MQKCSSPIFKSPLASILHWEGLRTPSSPSRALGPHPQGTWLWSCLLWKGTLDMKFESCFGSQADWSKEQTPGWENAAAARVMHFPKPQCALVSPTCDLWIWLTDLESPVCVVGMPMTAFPKIWKWFGKVAFFFPDMTNGSAASQPFGVLLCFFKRSDLPKSPKEAFPSYTDWGILTVEVHKSHPHWETLL